MCMTNDKQLYNNILPINNKGQQKLIIVSSLIYLSSQDNTFQGSIKSNNPNKTHSSGFEFWENAP